VGFGQHTLQQSGFARAQKAGEDGGWNQHEQTFKK
jgi:hypothetical protein